jgi:manganese-dependent inorganic pyrophosphatase
MEQKVYIIGHKNPDTDSICSAIGYCYYKKMTGHDNVCAARLGDINKETEFVLNYFNIAPPKMITTVKMQVKDLGIDRVVSISPDTTVLKAWTIMKKQKVKTLPVVDDFGQLLGVCTVSNLTNSYMDVSYNNLFANSNTSTENVLDTLSGTIVNNVTFNFSETSQIIVAAMDENEVVRRVGPNDIVITGDRDDVQKSVIEKGIGCLIVTGGYIPASDTIKSADSSGCMIMSVPYDSFTTSRLINQSIPVSYVMTRKNIVSFDIDDYIDDIKDTMLETRYRAYPVLEANRVIGTISRYHLIKGNRKKVILMDHNERSQTVDGLEEAEILEIIDHHRVGGIQTNTPIIFNNKPLGSTSTIVGELFLDNGVAIPSGIAGILCAAIISDTLLFKSPTSTELDEEIAHKLAKIAGIDIQKFSYDMFKAGTSVAGKSVKEIFYQDFKEFYLGKNKVGIGQVMTMDIDGIKYMRDEMLSFMEESRKAKGYDLVMLMLTDIIKENSEVLYTPEASRDMIYRAFNVQPSKNSVYLPGVVSRKKQIVPPIALVIK